MGYFSKLDIVVKSTPELTYIKAKPIALPIIFEHQIPQMAEPMSHRTRITPGTNQVCLWPGLFVDADWLFACIEWTQVPGWDTKVRLLNRITATKGETQ